MIKKIVLIYLLSILTFFFCNSKADKNPIVNGNQIENNLEESIKKVLFVGNSLTANNNLPGMFEAFAQEAGKEVKVDKYIKFGLAPRHYINESALKNKIKEQSWDYVVLQSDDITAFPDMYNIEENVLIKLKSMVLDNSSKTKIIYFMPWGIRNGVNIQELNGEFVFYSYNVYMNKIYDGVLYLADKMNLVIAPVGWVWSKVRAEKSEIELFAADKAHPSFKGSYLSAAVYFSLIFKESCLNINYDSTLNKEEAKYLRSKASSIVLDDLELWNVQ